MYKFLATAFLLLSNFAVASEACKINSIKSFYTQIKSNGPILEEINKRKKSVNSGIEVAKQRPNPILDLGYLKGDQFGVSTNSISMSAKHIIEFGSKRDKRVVKAQKLIALTNQQLDLKLYELNMESTISFQRLAQLAITIHTVKEAIHTFDKIVRKLSSRARLNPEETVSLSTLTLATIDYKAKLNDLENESGLINGKISYLSGCDSIQPKYFELKYSKLKIPKRKEVMGLLKLEQLKVDFATSDFDVEKSLGYSNISIGPVVEYQNQGRDEFISAGVSVSFALPLFQTNNGNKLRSANNLAVQKISSKNIKNLLIIKRRKLIEKYNRSLDTLNQMPSLADIEKQHIKTDKLFSRGVVSISMTIESHRQLIDFLNSKFDTENDLLSTYGNITLIDGDLNSFESLF
jgi:cobalt-zinc-cadmium efflux system outer membrane protein